MVEEIPTTASLYAGLSEVIPLDQNLIVDSSTKELKPFGEILEQGKPKLIALYYSMHNCPPCREFTPLLSMLYEEVNEDEKILEPSSSQATRAKSSSMSTMERCHGWHFQEVREQSWARMPKDLRSKVCRDSSC